MAGGHFEVVHFGIGVSPHKQTLALVTSARAVKVFPFTQLLVEINSVAKQSAIQVEFQSGALHCQRLSQIDERTQTDILKSFFSEWSAR